MWRDIGGLLWVFALVVVPIASSLLAIAVALLLFGTTDRRSNWDCANSRCRRATDIQAPPRPEESPGRTVYRRIKFVCDGTNWKAVSPLTDEKE